MAYHIVTLDNISEQLEGIQSTLEENNEVDCSCFCPSEDELENLLERLFVDNIKVTPPNVPVLFSTSDTSNNQDWTSPPFYTHPRGYKMKLVISHRLFNGYLPSAPDNPSGLYAKFILLDGEYDGYLRFPIRMTIEFHVFKKTTNDSRLITFCFDDSTPPAYTSRMSEGISWRNRRRSRPIRDVLLLREGERHLYSIDGCLTFKITNVETLYNSYM